MTSPHRPLGALGVVALGEAGVTVQPEWASSAACAELRAAAEEAWAKGAFRAAGLRVTGSPGPGSARVRGDSTYWPDASPPWAAIRARFEALRDELNREAFLGLTRFELQLARYPGDGSGYERHRDAFRGRGNRRVTAILYLNADWDEAQGGALRLFTGAGPRDVAPEAGTCVVFLSERVEHEVLPCHAPRFALTAWYYAHG